MTVIISAVRNADFLRIKFWLFYWVDKHNNIQTADDIWIDGYTLILKCIRIKDVNDLVARRHYEIIGLPA